MIYWHLLNNNEEKIEWSFLERAIRRNFSGMIELDPCDIFLAQIIKDKIRVMLKKSKLSVVDLIQEALMKKSVEE